MVVLVRSDCWSPENSCGRELSVDSKENWSRQSAKTRLPFVGRNARIFPEFPVTQIRSFQNVGIQRATNGNSTLIS